MSARAKIRVLARALSSDARLLSRTLASPRAAHSAHAFDDTLDFIRTLDLACSAEERTAHELSRAVALGGRLLVRELDAIVRLEHTVPGDSGAAGAFVGAVGVQQRSLVVYRKISGWMSES